MTAYILVVLVGAFMVWDLWCIRRDQKRFEGDRRRQAETSYPSDTTGKHGDRREDLRAEIERRRAMPMTPDDMRARARNMRGDANEVEADHSDFMPVEWDDLCNDLRAWADDLDASADMVQALLDANEDNCKALGIARDENQMLVVAADKVREYANSRIATLEAALRPFAVEHLPGCDVQECLDQVTWDDVDRAREALRSGGEEK